MGIAQDLIEEQKKVKQIAGLKGFRNEMSKGKIKDKIRRSNTITIKGKRTDFYKSTKAFN